MNLVQENPNPTQYYRNHIYRSHGQKRGTNSSNQHFAKFLGPIIIARETDEDQSRNSCPMGKEVKDGPNICPEQGVLIGLQIEEEGTVKGNRVNRSTTLRP
jgi:hypothetical protein